MPGAKRKNFGFKDTLKHYPDLLNIFVIFFMVAAITTIVLVGFGLYGINSKYIINNAEKSAVAISDIILQHSGEMLFTPDAQGGKAVQVSQNNFAALDELMRGHMHPLDIIKIKVYSGDLRIVYSTDKQIIGQVDTPNKDLQAVMGGKITSELKKKDKVWDLDDEERVDIDLIETYIPIRGEENQVIGSLEIYTDVTKYHKEILITLILSLILLSAVLLAMFVFLFVVMKRATKAIALATEQEKNLASALAAADTERKKAVELEKAYHDLKETQEMLIQAGKMAAVGQFASGIAHDLNNPLVGIVGNLDLLAMDPMITPEINQKFDEMRVQANRIKVMVNNLISFARNKKAQFAAVDVKRLLCSIQPLLVHSPDFKKIIWTEQVQDNLPCISGDFNRLQEVLVNLGMNACQATPEGGKITLTGRYNAENNNIEVSVSDTGQGIDKEYLDKIFTPFFSTKENGTGLGLTICRGIIEEHKGKITVESAKGKGTVFTIVFPVENDQADMKGS